MSSRSDAVSAPADLARVGFVQSDTVIAPLLRLWATAWLDARLGLFSPAPWVIGFILAALGYLTVRLQADTTSFHLGWVLAADVSGLASALLLFLSASLAHRPVRYEVAELEESKTTGSEELLFGRWLGTVLVCGVPLLLMLAAVVVGQAIHSKASIRPDAYAVAFLRLLPQPLFFVTLSFCLVCATRILVLGAGLSGLLWFALYAGATYYPTALRPDLSQNAPAYLGLTASVLALTLLGYRGARRARRDRRTLLWAVAAVLLSGATVVSFLWSARALPSRASTVEAWQRLRGSRPAPADPLTNFGWVDLTGRRISLARFRGRPTLVVLFTPRDTGIVPLLTRLRALRREFKESELGLLAVCVSEDLNGARDAARAARLSGKEFPIVTDWGSPFTGQFLEEEPASVFAWRTRIQQPPSALLLRANGTERKRGLPLDETSWADLRAELRAAIQGIEEESPQLQAPVELPMP